jgi:hypothetical protein
MAIRDISGWTQADPNSRIALGKYRARFTGLTKQEIAYLYDTEANLGANFSGDFTHHLTFELDDYTGASLVYPWVLKDGISDMCPITDSLYSPPHSDSGASVYSGSGWFARPFTVVATHYTYLLKIKAYKVGTPSNPLTIRIVGATDGHPDVTNKTYSTGTVNPTTFTATALPGAWQSISMSSYQLQAGTTYWLVVSSAGGNIDNRVFWVGDTDDGSVKKSTSSNDVWDTTYTTFTISYQEIYAPDAIFVKVAANVVSLDEWYHGTWQSSATTYTIPTRYRYRPLGLKVVRSGSTLTLNVYSDAAEQVCLTTGAVPTLALTSVEDYDNLYLLNTYYDNTASTAVSGMVGQLYIDEAPPAYFTVADSALLPFDLPIADWGGIHDGDHDDFSEYLTADPVKWTKADSGGTPTNEKGTPDGETGDWAHLVGDDTDDAGAYYTITEANHNSCMAGFKVHYVAGGSFDVGQVSSAYRVTGASYWAAAQVYRTADGYFWRLKASMALGTLTGTNATYQLSMGKTYQTVLAVSVSVLAHAILYVRCLDDTTDTATTYKSWTPVDILYLGSGLPLVLGFTKVYAGVTSATFDDEVGDRYLSEFKFIPYHTDTTANAIARGGVGDKTLGMVVMSNIAHADVDHMTLFKKVDGGDWALALENFETYCNLNQGIVYDDANARWLSCKSNYWTEDFDLYESADLTNWSLLAEGAQGFFPSRIIEGGKLYGFGFQTAVGGKYPFAFCKLTLANATMESAWLYKDEDVLTKDCFEWYFFRRTSDSRLMAMCRADPTAAPYPSTNWIVECQDVYGAANEGVNKDSGTADGNTANKLIDSGAAWTTTVPVAVGWSAWNTTDGTRGYVKAIDNATTLSIMDINGADVDLFPDGNETYVLSCWGKPQGITPSGGLAYGTSDYDSRTAWLSCFAFAGNLYMQAANRRYFDAVSDDMLVFSITRMTVCKASAETGQIIAERQWDYVGGGTYASAAGLLLTGNGSIDAARQSGNHYIDYTSQLGVAMYLKLDVIDILSPAAASWNKRSIAAGKSWNKHENLASINRVVLT